MKNNENIYLNFISDDYLDACVFLLSFRELSREFADIVESLRDNESACCTPERTIDNCFSATLYTVVVVSM